MAQHIDLARLEQAMQASKKYTDDQKTAVEAKVTELSGRVDIVEGTVTQHTSNIDTINKKLENGVQAPDPALDSISNLTGTGVVKMTGEDTFAVDTIADTDVKAGEAIAFAKDAFAAKDGSMKTTSVTSENALTLVAADDGQGKPNVLIKTPSGTADRVVGVSEMNKAIAEAGSTSHVYMGMFTFYATADTAENAKAKITKPSDNDTAVIFAAGKVETGKYAESAWTWEAATWKDGCWAWVEDLLSESPAGDEYPSGRIILNQKEDSAAMDVIEDRIGKPDNIGLTYTDTGAIGFKKVTDADNYGSNPVLGGVDAAGIGYGEGKTIKEKIASMEYTIASEEEIRQMLTRVFGA